MIFKKNAVILVATFILFSNCSKKDSVPDPFANFSFSAVGSNTHAPATINFTNSSFTAIVYSWNFGDGVNSSEASPSHKYTTAGNYTVTLTASSLGKTSTKTQTVNIQAAYTKIAIRGIALSSTTETSSFTGYFRFASASNTELWKSGNVTINPSSLPSGWTITSPYVFPSLLGTSYIELWKVGTFSNTQVASTAFIPSLFNTGDIATNSYPASMPGATSSGLSFLVQWQ